MGNSNTTDAVEPLKSDERIERLVHGYMRINFAKYQQKMKSFHINKKSVIPMEVITICYQYIGDTLSIKSLTQIKTEKIEKRKEKKHRLLKAMKLAKDIEFMVLFVGLHGSGKID